MCVRVGAGECGEVAEDEEELVIRMAENCSESI